MVGYIIVYNFRVWAINSNSILEHNTYLFSNFGYNACVVKLVNEQNEQTQ